jgi:lysophospholipase L1-like esterase
MGKIDWDIVTNYSDTVTTTLKTVTFPKVQEQVYLRNQGNANFTYTIGSQSGTLTPGQSVTVNQDVSSFTLQAASGTHTFELRAKEKGTEQTETETDVISLLAKSTKQNRLAGSFLGKQLFGTLNEGTTSLVLNCVGDSLSNDRTDWYGLLLDKIASKFPNYNIKYAPYDNVNNRYGAWQFINNAGSERCVTNYRDGYPLQLNKSDIPLTSADFDITVRCAMDNWNSGTFRYLASRYGAGGSRCWQLGISSTNKIQFYWSETGANTDKGNVFSAVDTSAYVNGKDYWIRVSLDVDDGAGHYVLKCYTSTDGVTWVEAQSLQGTAITSIYDDPSQVISLGGIGNVIGNSLGKFYDIRIRNGIDGVNVCPQPIEVWNQLTSDTYIGARIEGTPTIYAYNGAIAGYSTTNFSDVNLINKIIPVSMNAIVFVCLGHNDTINYGNSYFTTYNSMVTNIKARITNPLMCVLTQNKELSPSLYIKQHAMRRQQQIAYAQTHGMEIIDIWNEFEEDSRNITDLVLSDGIHPTAAGQQLIADTVWDYSNIYGI